VLEAFTSAGSASARTTAVRPTRSWRTTRRLGAVHRRGRGSRARFRRRAGRRRRQDHVSGQSIVLTGEIKDFPARRLIARTDYRGGMGDLRRLVHRFADDIALHLTGEAGISQTRIAYVVKGARSSELYVVDVDGFGARPLTAFKSPLVSPAWSTNGADLYFAALRGAAWNLYAVPLVRRHGAPGDPRGGSPHIALALAPDGAPAFASNQGRQQRDLRRQRGRLRRAAADGQPRDRHLAFVVAERPGASRSRRRGALGAGLRHGPGRRQPAPS
jgi:hypothetical protein